MAKDVSNKTTSNSNTDDNSSAISDQQKVPPLRIVLNTSGNQKSSTTAIAVSSNQQQSVEKSQDGKNDPLVKTGGRVRIKLGTNKQAAVGGKGADSTATEESSQNKPKQASEKQQYSTKEELNASFGHLRRITRRSQRSAQTVTNEDEESKSSMTSIDENQNTNTNSDNTNSQDNTTQGASNQQTSSAANNNPPTNNPPGGSLPPEPTRKYKRRRGETSESQSCDPHDLFFGFQSYKLPGQNSIQLFKNIRQQVDKRLKNLSNVNLKAPHGFRDFMISRGAYLLDGNKLGNGTNLYMNDEGGLHTVPIGKYHALTRHNRVTYSVPNRAKVPLGLAINSPLYNLFIEQEKERYRMQIQHIKEREKLTLAAEQEMIRVHNQAAMAAANQSEPFSACTMLKHQEIYNYMDADGVNILSSEDAQQDGAKQPNNSTGTTTRTRNREHISPTRTSTTSTTTPTTTTTKPTTTTTTTTSDINTKEDSTIVNFQSEDKLLNTNSVQDESPGTTKKIDDDIKSPQEPKDKANPDAEQVSAPEKEEDIKPEKIDKPVKVESEDQTKDLSCEKKSPVEQNENEELKDTDNQTSKTDEITSKIETTETKEEPSKESKLDENKSGKLDENLISSEGPTREKSSDGTGLDKPGEEKVNEDPEQVEENKPAERVGPNGVVPMEQDSEGLQDDKEPNSVATNEILLSDEERRVYDRSNFVSHLQEIDDKWDKIRGEMLIRHRNEADSLYAVQKLEWEWKTKEIGACDVRTTPVIDSSLVPKLNIYSQDY